jgi:tetratricopeptide (TPR) repeat protein
MENIEAYNVVVTALDPLLSTDPKSIKTFLRSIEPRSKRRHYRAASNYNYLCRAKLLKIGMDSLSLESQKADMLIEAIYHLQEAHDYTRCLAILQSLVDEEINLSLYSHFLYRGKAKQLLNLTDDLLDHFQDINAKYFLNVAQARALENLGRRSEAIEIYERICEVEPEESLEFIEAFSRLANCQVQSGEYGIGIKNTQKAFKILDILNSERIDLKADLIEQMAFYQMNSGNLDEAFNSFGEVFHLRKQQNLVTSLVNPLGHQGIVLRKGAVSPKYLVGVLTVNILQFFRIRYLASIVFDKLCEPFIVKLNNNYSRAEQLFNQAFTLSDEIGDTNIRFFILYHLVWVLINKGQAASAKSYALQALEGYQAIDDRRGISDCHEQLGRIYLALDCSNTDIAKYHFSTSLNIRHEIQNRHGIASSTLNFAFLCWHQRSYWKSIKFLIEGISKYHEIGRLNLKRTFAIMVLFSVWTVGKRDWTL